MKSHFYYISNSKDTASILKGGIEAINKCIHLITSKDFAKRTAKDMGYDSFIVFQVDSKGIQGAIEPDVISIPTAPYKVILRQDIVFPEYLKADGYYNFALLN